MQSFKGSIGTSSHTIVHAQIGDMRVHEQLMVHWESLVGNAQNVIIPSIGRHAISMQMAYYAEQNKVLVESMIIHMQANLTEAC